MKKSNLIKLGAIIALSLIVIAVIGDLFSKDFSRLKKLKKSLKEDKPKDQIDINNEILRKQRADLDEGFKNLQEKRDELSFMTMSYEEFKNSL